jgi:hypothetical protein
VWLPAAIALLVAMALVMASPAQQPREQTQRPTQELFEERAPGVLVRVTHRTSASPGLSVQIWDLLVAPGKRSGAVVLPGAAVVSVRSGEATLVIDSEARRVAIGTSLGVAEGAEIHIDNRESDARFAARAIVVSRR